MPAANHVRQIKPLKLTATAFATFGDVIEAGEQCEHYPINQGSCERYNNLASLDLHEHDGQACLSIFRANALPHPIIIRSMERHPLSSQAFYPLSTTPFLVVVAPPGPFDATKIEVFISNGRQGVNYRAGCWHHFCLVLEKTADFLVVDRTGPGNNCDEINLNPDQLIEIILKT